MWISIFCKACARNFCDIIIIMQTETNSCDCSDVAVNIKNRFFIVLMLSILLSSALASFYGLQKASSNLSFLAILTPAMFILSYGLYEILKKRINAFYLWIINIELLVSVFMFVCPLLFVSFYKNSINAGFLMNVLLYLSVYCVPLVAIVTTITMIVAPIMSNKKAKQQ